MVLECHRITRSGLTNPQQPSCLQSCSLVITIIPGKQYEDPERVAHCTGTATGLLGSVAPAFQRFLGA